MSCSWFTDLKIKRFHILCFILWQLCITCAGQALFSIFFNLSPQFRFDNGDPANDTDWLSKADCNSTDPFDWSKNVTFRAPFQSAVQEFRLICGHRAYFSYLISTIQFFGVLIGAILFGQISDMFGRKFTGCIVLTLGCVFCIIGGASVSWHMLAVCRFLVGASVGGIMVVLFAFVIELIEPEQRIFLRSFFNWGWCRMFLTIVCFIFPEWRLSSYILGVFFLTPLILLILLFPGK